MITVDANILLPFLSPIASVPVDKATGQPINYPMERIEGLIEQMSKGGSKILVPTPVLSECLVRAGAALGEYLKILRKYSVFRVADFDARAAIELAILTSQAVRAGDKKSGSTSPWAKVKFDRQIVAISKVHNAQLIYSDDPGLRHFAQLSGLSVLGLADCPIPSSKRQPALALTGSASESSSKP